MELPWIRDVGTVPERIVTVGWLAWVVPLFAAEGWYSSQVRSAHHE